jgi:glycosyltransferase involved in cell wall biosynthesis
MITIVIPSKKRARQSEFLMHSIHSIWAESSDIEIIVAVDEVEVPEFSGVRFVQGKGGQAEALNAGCEAARGDYIGFLEDDDRWMPGRLKAALEALMEVDFTSSTQLEVDLEGRIIRINDFPTPSGWLMTRKTWEEVGPFNTDFRYHLDNEWLGRLTRSGLKRAHLVEATAPQIVSDCLYRPYLAQISRQGAESILWRHSDSHPLIKRTVHKESNMVMLSQSSVAGLRSQSEYNRLAASFGSVPC